jgi:hypothetical protein
MWSWAQTFRKTSRSWLDAVFSDTSCPLFLDGLNFWPARRSASALFFITLVYYEYEYRARKYYCSSSRSFSAVSRFSTYIRIQYQVPVRTYVCMYVCMYVHNICAFWCLTFARFYSRCLRLRLTRDDNKCIGISKSENHQSIINIRRGI